MLLPSESAFDFPIDLDVEIDEFPEIVAGYPWRMAQTCTGGL